MNFITPKQAKDHPKTAICETHGEYEVKLSEPLFDRVFVSTCFECAKEGNERRELEEVKRQESETKDRMEMAWNNAGVSKRLFDKGFNDFIDDTEGKAHAKRAAMGLCDAIKGNRNTGSIIMNGGVGTGKTALCTSIIKELAFIKRVRMIKAVDMIRNLKGTWSRDNDATEAGLIEFYSRLDLLVIDEVGVQFGSDTEKMFMFDIIDGRYQEMKPTILISNLAIAGIKDLIGERVIDRLREDGGKLVSFDWPSYRS